jgi:hypothetical protein
MLSVIYKEQRHADTTKQADQIILINKWFSLTMCGIPWTVEFEKSRDALVLNSLFCVSLLFSLIILSLKMQCHRSCFFLIKLKVCLFQNVYQIFTNGNVYCKINNDGSRERFLFMYKHLLL